MFEVMKPYYSDYVEYAMRYYVKCQKSGQLPDFRTAADRANYMSCYTALYKIPQREKDLVVSVYASKDTLPDNVYAYCQLHGVEQSWVWAVIRRVERKFATVRGLI